MQKAPPVVLAEYFVTEDLTLLFIFRADFDRPKVFKIEMSLEDIRKFVATGLAKIKSGTQSPDKSISVNNRQTHFSSLSELIKPILSWTDEGDIVWFVPHDVLHYVPFHVFRFKGRYLIERNPICYTPSASLMKYCQANRKKQRDRILVLADSRANLLYAREEAFAIKQLFAPHAEVYLGDAATKKLLKQRLDENRENIDVLHFACHGHFDGVEPLQSYILLADGHNVDSTSIDKSEPETEKPSVNSGKLTADEIFDLDIQADLITLSACESGISELRPGDELIGLTRAFILAGTPSVIVSLWEVDDVSTSILMTEFYRSLRAGTGKAKALQEAQIELMTKDINDVIDYCDKAKSDLSLDESSALYRALDRKIADLQFQANDFAAALERYTSLQRGLNATGEYHSVRKAANRCKTVLQEHDSQPIDYTVPVYQHPYFWAPFILIGDWE